MGETGCGEVKGQNQPRRVVVKVGGSCLDGDEAVKAAVSKIKQVKEQGLMPVVVVSAFKGVTDSLVKEAANRNPQDPKETDRILSRGEQMSAKAIHSAIESAGLKSRAVLLSEPDFPIVTDNQHGSASALLDASKINTVKVLNPLLEEGVIPVVPGFVGKTKDGTITTMGRGASDTTAILLGKILKAQEVILLKDVPGILSGDSKKIKSPKRLHQITVEEVLNLGIKGGKVLYPVSLMYKPKDVRVRVVNFDNGNILKGGTEITGELEDSIKVELDNEKKTAVTVIGNRMSEIPRLLEKFSGALSRENINIFAVSASEFSICFYVDMKDAPAAMEALHELVLGEERLTAVTSMEDISLIIIVGKDFATHSGIIGKIGTALAERGINIIDFNTSVCEADIFVRSEDAEITKELLEGCL
jgi:aspartate kinase